MTELKRQTSDWKTTLTIIGAFFLIICLWLGTWCFLKPANPETRSIEDLFGAIGALFSGLAFAAIIITVVLQKKDLKFQREDLALQKEDLLLQREELKLTREELKRTADAQEESEKALKRQAASLKMSAKLSALSSLLNYYTEESKSSTSMRMENNHKRLQYINYIEEILESKMD